MSRMPITLGTELQDGDIRWRVACIASGAGERVYLLVNTEDPRHVGHYTEEDVLLMESD